MTSLDIETRAAHAGAAERIGDGTATAPSIHPSTSYSYQHVEDVHAALGDNPRGFAYSRNANPTVVLLETALQSIEGTDSVVAFGSGMAAIYGALVGSGLSAGDCVTVATDLYGMTRTVMNQLAEFDITADYVDILDLGAVERSLMTNRSRVLYFESISNPRLRIPDMVALVEIAHRHRAVVMVDHTFATSCLVQPNALGVDIVIHSATKYIGGHGDVTAGVVACSESLGRRIRAVRTATGGILSPFDAWLTLRGLRTMPIRVERQCATALEVARWLDQQSWVKSTHYPGLSSHPQHALAEKQFSGGYGAVVSFDLHGTREGALRFMDSLTLISSATTLGDVVSLVLYPQLASHRGLSPEELEVAGIGESMIRLSTGLESTRDLVHDLEGAARTAGIWTATGV